MVKGMQFMIDDSYRMDEVGDDESNQPSPSPPSPPPPPQSNNTGGKMAKGMQFLIKDSYTMDEVDDDDDPSPSLSSPTPPSQSNEEAEQHEKSDLKRPPEELLSSPQTLYVAEEKKSDSVGSSNALADVIILNESDESDDHENKEIASSLFADLSITPQSSNLHEEAIQSSSTQNNTIESSPAVTNAIDNNISGGKKTMAMVKFRVWDPAAPSKQFKFITATTVLLLPQSSNNNDGADDEKGNNESSSNDLKKIERLYSNSRQQKMQLQQRLSSVKEERRGSRDSTIYDDTTDEDETDTNNSNHANNGSGEDDEQQQQQEGGRRRTIKIDNKSIKNNLSQLSNDEDDDDDENDDDKMNQLQVGNVVGIYLKKSSLSSTKSNNNNNSSTQQINNTTTAKNINEWKVGNSIRVLHNLNLIPLHTTGLEQLLHQIESNHPSLRELILDGITTIPQQYSSLSTTTTSQQHQHQLLTPLSTSHMEVLIEAIGKNTSIKKCSLRYSQITDDIASMLALALVDNTTMTSLSLRGNQLTSSSIKNFYSVLKSDENISLRLLDISDNSLIEDDVQCAFEQFMQQRNMKRKLILRAEKAKRIARGMPLLNEMLEEEEEEEEEEGGWRIGSGVVGGRRHVTNNGSDGGGSGGGCCVTVVCHPGIMDGTFYHETQQLLRRSDGSSGNSFGSYPQSVGVMAGGGSRTGEEEEEYQRFAESVSSDITGIGNEGARGSPSQQQQQQQLQPFVQPIGSELYPQSQPHYRQQQQQHHQEPMPYHPQQRRSNNRRLDPNYNMMFSSQGSSSEEGGNDSSTTSNTGNESLDQRQRQQLATVNGGVGGRVGGGQNHHNSPNRNRRSYNSRPSTTTASTTSNNSLNLSAQDYMDDKADEREIRRQLATQGQAIGAYAIDDEAPNRQEIRGRRTRVSRTESQRRARLAELGNNGSGGSGGGGVATTTIAEGDLVDADIERMEEYEYRNLSMSQKAFSKIGLGGEDKWTERVVCLTFGVCFLVLVIAISLYVARG